MSVTSNRTRSIQQNVVSKIQISKIFQPYGNISHASPLYRELRKRYLGASEVADAANALGAYNSRKKLLTKKTYLSSLLRSRKRSRDSSTRPIWEMFPSSVLDDDDESFINPALQWGTFHEQFARSDLLEIFTLKLLKRQIWTDPTEYLSDGGFWINQNDVRYSCSPDGIFQDKYGVLEDVVQKLRETHGVFDDYQTEEQRMWLVEYKCPYKCQKYDAIPNHHRCQILAQMAATGIHKVLYCVYVPGEPMDVWVSYFDPVQWNRIKTESDLFLTMLEDPESHRNSKFGNKLVVDLKHWKITDKDGKCIFGFF